MKKPQLLNETSGFFTFYQGFTKSYRLTKSNEIDGANYEMDGVKHEIDGVNLEIDGANHIKQSSTLQST